MQRTMKMNVYICSEDIGDAFGVWLPSDGGASEGEMTISKYRRDSLCDGVQITLTPICKGRPLWE
jgi:hypothetical protein